MKDISYDDLLRKVYNLENQIVNMDDIHKRRIAAARLLTAIYWELLREHMDAEEIRRRRDKLIADAMEKVNAGSFLP